VDGMASGQGGRALLAGEKSYRTELFASIAPGDLEFESAWRAYMLLETFDYLSLLTCFGFESEGCGPVPTLQGQWEHLSVTRTSPWEVRLTPFPFPGDELEVDVEIVHIDGTEFDSEEALRARFDAAVPDKRPTIYPSGGLNYPGLSPGASPSHPPDLPPRTSLNPAAASSGSRAGACLRM